MLRRLGSTVASRLSTRGKVAGWLAGRAKAESRVNLPPTGPHGNSAADTSLSA